MTKGRSPPPTDPHVDYPGVRAKSAASCTLRGTVRGRARLRALNSTRTTRRFVSAAPAQRAITSTCQYDGPAMRRSPTHDRRLGARLYLEFTLGVNPGGSTPTATLKSSPKASQRRARPLFHQGQNWGFRHRSDALREDHKPTSRRPCAPRFTRRNPPHRHAWACCIASTDPRREIKDGVNILPRGRALAIMSSNRAATAASSSARTRHSARRGPKK